MYLKLYRLFSFIAGPLIDLWFLNRKKNGKEDSKRFSERLGHPGFPRPEGSLIWMHAASVGEIMSVLPLITYINEKYADINILVTTGTVTSAKLLDKRLPKKVMHQYVPIDKLPTVLRFLNHWRPDFVLWVESELWPNLIIETHKTGCPMAQINARISKNSFNKWQKCITLANHILESFTINLSQSNEDKDRYTALGSPNAKYVGNLKYDADPLPADPKETGQLVNMIGNRPIWIAASTHFGEEELIAYTHKILLETHKNLLLIIIPRHPDRGKEIKNLLDTLELKSSIRSENEMIDEETNIYIANTIGELGIFYRLANIVFMGGSLVEHGGQNPLEAARLQCSLLTGVYTENFIKIYSELEENKALIRVNSPQNLAEKIDLLLKDHELQEKLSSTALELIKSKQGVLKNYIEELSPFITPLSNLKDDKST